MKLFKVVTKPFIAIFIVGVCLCLGVGTAWPQTLTTLTIDPKATYLHVDATDAGMGVLDAPAIDLGALGIVPGNFLKLEQLGAFKLGTAYNDDATSMGGIFSSTNALGPTSDLNRVTGAIDAGVDVFTDVTYFLNEPTDIAEDFQIDPSVIVQVPAGANYLFIAALDASYSDNTDPNGDFGVRITKVPDLSIWVDKWFRISVAGSNYHFIGMSAKPPNPIQRRFPAYMKIVSWDSTNQSFSVNLYNKNDLGNWDPTEYINFTFNYYAGSDLKFVCNFEQITTQNTIHTAVLFIGKRNAKGNFLMAGRTHVRTLGGYYFEIDDIAANPQERWAGSVKLTGSMIPESKVPSVLLVP
jgi:hypothetical protein